MDSAPPNPTTFTLHRDSGWSGAALGLALAVVAEALPVHFLFVGKYPALAWVLTATSASALFWLAADARALARRPTTLDDDALHVRVGSRWSARVPLAAIAAVRDVRNDAPGRRERGYLRATVFGDPAIVIDLSEPVLAHGPYGITKRVTRIGLAPDERARFRAALDAALAARSPARATHDPARREA